MGVIGLFLCVFIGHFVTVQSEIKELVDIFSHDFPGHVEKLISFPLGNNLDFTPYDTVFSSLRTWSPDFHRLVELHPNAIAPRVQVLCDDSKLTLLVDKRSNGVLLSGKAMQLGYGCYSNGELPEHFVFTYNFDQCGTTYVMLKGMKMFTNILYLNPIKGLANSLQTPSTVHISCIPKRSYDKTNYIASPDLPENDKSLNMEAMNPSWTSIAESNIYERGHIVNLQVSARLRADRQLFIQSCFASETPNPQTKPKQAVIINKGCTALGSLDVQFVASNRSDVVNIVLNTFNLISEKVYIHCSVLISDHGITSGSKSCNYNVINLRWEELSGDVEVCKCCSSKCKGLSHKYLSKDAKAIVSTGPLIIMDKAVETSRDVSEPEENTSFSATGSSSDGNEITDLSVSSWRFLSSPQDAVVMNQDPVTRLALWLPEQEQDADQSHYIAPQFEDSLTHKFRIDDSAELQPSTTDQETLLNPLTNTVNSLDLNERQYPLNLLEGWPVPPKLDYAGTVEERKNKYGGFEKFGTEALQGVNIPESVETNVNDDFNQMEDDVAQMQADAPMMPPQERNVEPIIRSKIQFSKGKDGSQMLSYEEEVVKTQEGKGVMRCGMDWIKRKQESGLRGLYSTFLNLLRRMDRAE